jgi:hypothetical protein
LEILAAADDTWTLPYQITDYDPRLTGAILGGTLAHLRRRGWVTCGLLANPAATRRKSASRAYRITWAGLLALDAYYERTRLTTTWLQ